MPMYNVDSYFPSKSWAKKCALYMAKYGNQPITSWLCYSVFNIWDNRILNCLSYFELKLLLLAPETSRLTQGGWGHVSLDYPKTLVTYFWGDKFSQIWLKTTQINFLIVPEVRPLNSSSWQGWVPSGGLGENRFPCFLSSIMAWTLWLVAPSSHATAS